MANSANTYGGKDSWDDYDNGNMMKPRPLGETLRISPKSKKSDEEEEPNPTVEGTAGSRAGAPDLKIMYRKNIPF